MFPVEREILVESNSDKRHGGANTSGFKVTHVYYLLQADTVESLLGLLN